MPAQSLFLNGQWTVGAGEAFHSTNPATGEKVWEGRSSSTADVDQAVDAASRVLPDWANVPVENRIRYLEAFVAQLKLNRARLVEMISREAGKPAWESNTE